MRFFYDHRLAEAEVGFAEVTRCKPAYSFAWHGVIRVLLAEGRVNEALEAASTTWKLDAISAANTGLLCLCYYYARQFRAAVAMIEHAITAGEGYSVLYAVLGFCYLQLGNSERAIDHLESAHSLFPEVPLILAYLGYVCAVSNQPTRANAALKLLQRNGDQDQTIAYYLAIVHLGLGDLDRTFAYLGRSYESRSPWLLFLNPEPIFDSVRRDTRFIDLLLKMGLPRR